MRAGQYGPICERSGPGRWGAARLPREGFEPVEKLRDVVLNCPDYLSMVLCRSRWVVEARHPGSKTAQPCIAHDIGAENRVAGWNIEELVAGEHRQDVSRERELQDLDDERQPPRSLRTKDALSRHRVLQGRLPQRQQRGQAARQRVDGSVAAPPAPRGPRPPRAGPRRGACAAPPRPPRL